jgi:hypothetical protein
VVFKVVSNGFKGVIVVSKWFQSGFKVVSNGFKGVLVVSKWFQSCFKGDSRYSKGFKGVSKRLHVESKAFFFKSLDC